MAYTRPEYLTIICMRNISSYIHVHVCACIEEVTCVALAHGVGHNCRSITVHPVTSLIPTHTEIRVDWQTYNILQEDGDLVDVITTIGPPFPKHTPSPSPPHPHISSTQRCSGGGVDPKFGDSDENSNSHAGLESDPVVRVFLRAHEGVKADKPFSVQPTQMVWQSYSTMMSP